MTLCSKVLPNLGCVRQAYLLALFSGDDIQLEHIHSGCQTQFPAPTHPPSNTSMTSSCVYTYAHFYILSLFLLDRQNMSMPFTHWFFIFFGILLQIIHSKLNTSTKECTPLRTTVYLNLPLGAYATNWSP